MTETTSKPEKPERAPRLRPNRDRKTLPASENQCHVCGDFAEKTCPQCHLPVCQQHSVSLEPELAAIFGAWACSECAARARAELQLDQQQWQRKRHGDVEFRTCGVCGEEFEQVLLACRVCGQRVCRTHRTRYRKKFYFGKQAGAQTGGWYWDYDVRCPAHRMHALAARLKGWEIDPTTEQDEDRSLE